MIPFLEFILNKLKPIDSVAWLNSLKKVTVIQKDIRALTKELEQTSADLIREQSADVFISIKDFMDIMNSDTISINNILAKSKHISELNSQTYSTIEVYPIVEDDHIVLCPDTKTCDKHKDYCGDKIKIVMVR